MSAQWIRDFRERRKLADLDNEGSIPGKIHRLDFVLPMPAKSLSEERSGKHEIEEFGGLLLT